MKQYKVGITELLQKEVTVTAEDEQEAITIVTDQYKNEEIVLTSDNFVDTVIDIIGE